MKRKIFIVVLIISAIVLPLTAKSSNDNPNYIGGYFGGDFNFRGVKDSDISYTINGLAFGVEGANFFGKEGNIGAAYSLGGISTLSYKSGDSKLDASDEPLKLDVSVTFLYRYPVSKEFSVATGLGVGYGLQSEKSDYSSWSRNTVSLFGDLKAMFNVVDSVKLFGGVKLGGAVYMSSTAKVGNVSNSKETNYSEFRVTPYVGVGFAY